MQKIAAAAVFLITFAAHGIGLKGQIESQFGYTGQCSENDRRDTIHNSNADFKATWKACGKSTNGSVSGTTGCLKRHYPELSLECAECFGNFVGCARSHCWTQCWRNPDGASCESCSTSHCQPRLLSCTGIPEEQLPLFSW